MEPADGIEENEGTFVPQTMTGGDAALEVEIAVIIAVAADEQYGLLPSSMEQRGLIFFSLYSSILHQVFVGFFSFCRNDISCLILTCNYQVIYIYTYTHTNGNPCHWPQKRCSTTNIC